ncbi:MAG TPA: MerR family transcriptional regulator [Bacteroidetes bacterium]|nr:merR family regulatory protein [bacterium BMS3Bbin04]HDO64420.1 MerR family transcriptional regulator [Bacteroidota bacterium]HEX03545.1 MerR family transcriptional regulator [Bacteroidota bacterium]
MITISETDAVFQNSRTIGEAANELKVSASTLRVYDACGLVVLPRDVRGYRWVSDKEMDRIRVIRSFIRDHKLNVKSVRILSSHLPCWMVQNCNARRQESCEYLLGRDEPCWQYHRDTGGCLDNECVDCDIYENAIDMISRLPEILRGNRLSDPAA